MDCAGAARLRLGKSSSKVRKALYMAQNALVEESIGMRRLKTRRRTLLR